MDTIVNVQTNLIIEVINTLNNKGIKSLKNKLLLSLPDNIFAKGSSLWWEQGNLKAKSDISSGQVFDSLK